MATSKGDEIFWREFGLILLLLTLFGVAMFFLARAIGANAFERMQASDSAVAERIAPFGSARVGDPKAQTAAEATAGMQLATAAPAASGPPKSGPEVYAASCAACHVAGVAGAPKLGDAAAWAPRVAQGFDALVTSVVNGKGAMPPKGGMATLTEDEIRAAVTHMLKETGVEAAGMAGQQVASAAGAAVEGAKAAMEKAATSANQAMEKVTEAAKETMSETVAEAKEMVAAAAGTGASFDAAAGEAVYGQACMACHATGVAGSPKLGDAEAWAPRAALGVDAMLTSVLQGKGAMPPKAGRADLGEDDFRNAIGYMLEKSGVAAN